MCFCLPDFPLPTGTGAHLQETKVSSTSLVPKNRNGEQASFLNSPQSFLLRGGGKGGLHGNNTTVKAGSSTMCSTFHMFLSPLPMYYSNQFILSCEIEAKYCEPLSGWWSHGSSSVLSNAAVDILSAKIGQNVHPASPTLRPHKYSLCPLPSTPYLCCDKCDTTALWSTTHKWFSNVHKKSLTLKTCSFL